MPYVVYRTDGFVVIIYYTLTPAINIGIALTNPRDTKETEYELSR